MSSRWCIFKSYQLLCFAEPAKLSAWPRLQSLERAQFEYACRLQSDEQRHDMSMGVAPQPATSFCRANAAGFFNVRSDAEASADGALFRMSKSGALTSGTSVSSFPPRQAIFKQFHNLILNPAAPVRSQRHPCAELACLLQPGNVCCALKVRSFP